MMLSAEDAHVLREQFIKVTQQIRAELEANRDIGYFHLTCTTKGRTTSGEALLSFSLSTSEYNLNAVEGNDLVAVLTECLRRCTYEEENQKLALPSPGDEIPL